MNDLFQNKIKNALKNQHTTFENKGNLWQKIENNLHLKSNWQWKLIVRYAAVLIPALLIISFLFTQNNMSKSEQYFQKLNKDFEEKEFYYNTLILNKYEELEMIPHEDMDMLSLFFEELKQLDELYNKQKEELISSGYNQEIIESMLETKKLKLDILNTIIVEYNHIKEFKNEKSQNHIEHI